MTPTDAPLADALARLPHGPEFRFVDRLLSLTPGREGVGEYQVPPDAPFLRGHFPGQPLFPAVLLVEAAAQLAGVVAQSDPAVPAWPVLKLTALQQVKIRGAARPGQTVRLMAHIVGRLGPLIQAQVLGTIPGTVLLSAGITLSGEGRPQD